MHGHRFVADDRPDADNLVVVLELAGDVRFEDFRACLDQVAADPRYTTRCAGFVDLRRVDTGLDLEDTERLARHVLTNQLSCARWAVVADSPMRTALSVFYETTVSPQHEVKVFSTVEAAAIYLGIASHLLIG